MRILLSIVFAVSSFISVFCQTQVLDKNNNMPIPYAYIISSSGSILGVTDINGFVNTDGLIADFNLQKSDSVEISHLSYHNKKIKAGLLIQNKVIFLNKKEIHIGEVIARSEKPEYLVLKGFFRSCQLDNNVPKAYMDGIVEYYIPIGNRNNRLKNNIIENRTFRNPKLFDSKVKYYSETSGDRTGPPYIEKKTALSKLFEYKLMDKKGDKSKILSENDTIGFVFSDSLNKTITVNIDIISPERSYERNIMDFNVKFVEFVVSEYYSSGLAKWDRKSNLQVRSEYRKQLVSHKKLKQSPILVESFHEFHVLERRYISHKEYKEKKLSVFFGSQKTNYSTKYWEDNEKYGISPVPDFIENLFGNILMVY